jgi:hypothetical protein
MQTNLPQNYSYWRSINLKSLAATLLRRPITPPANKLQNKLDSIFQKIQRLLDTQTDDRPLEPRGGLHQSGTVLLAWGRPAGAAVGSQQALRLDPQSMHSELA